MKNATLVLALALAFAGRPDAVGAQQVQMNKATLIVSEETAIQLDRAPERNESITWTIVTGEGELVGDVTQRRVTFRATKPGSIVVVCVIHAPGVPERRPSVTFVVTGPATPVPAVAPVQPPPQPPKPTVSAPAPAATSSPKPAPVPAPPPNRGILTLRSLEEVVPVGWMGDAIPENDGSAVLDGGHTSNCHPNPSCVRVEYRPGKLGWAAFAWQRVPQGTMNWGEYPGLDLSRGGYQSIRWFARGDLSASGGTPPKAQFKSGGNVAPNFTDNRASYSASGDTVELSAEWKEYCLDLRGKDLGNVVSPFTVVLTKVANPKNAVIVIDDIVFSTAICGK